jgi:hypothetical protein
VLFSLLLLSSARSATCFRVCRKISVQPQLCSSHSSRSLPKIVFFGVLCVIPRAGLRDVAVWVSEFGSHFLHSLAGSDFDGGLHLF